MTSSISTELRAYADRLLAGTGLTIEDALDPDVDTGIPAAQAIRDGWDAAANPPEPIPDRSAP